MIRRVAAVLIISVGVVGSPQAVRADLSDGEIDAIKDAIGEGWEPIIAAVEDMLAAFQFVVTTGDMPATIAPDLISSSYDWVGASMRSYLVPGSAAGHLEEMFSEDVPAVSIGDIRYLQRVRLDDRTSRAIEVLEYAASATAGMTQNSTLLNILAALNKTPLGMAFEQQVGNEAALSTAGSLERIVGLEAQQTQMAVDESMQIDHANTSSFNWAVGHYKNSGWFNGAKSWEPEIIGIRQFRN